MFCFVFIFVLVCQAKVIVRPSQDDHPFVDDQHHDKFMLIPSIGYEMSHAPGKFTLTLNGWHYEPLKPGFLQSAIEKSVEVALNLIDSSVALTSDKKQERLGPFFVRDVHDHKIHLKLSKSISKTITTDADGRFHEKIVVDSLDGLDIRGSAVTYLASDNANNQQVSQGTIYLMRSSERGGCSIISDIDDTIKISDVPNKQRLMTNTFKKDFVPVPGMSELYRAWQSAHHCSVHYVSAMPSQLYYVTQKFLRKERFPGGSFHMRHLKLVSTEKSLLLLKLSEFIQHEGSRKHKLNVIEDILQHAPIGRRFVMVGDSGELDPEIYGAIARRHADRIQMIFIRRVNGGLNTDERFRKAFEDVPVDRWKLFTDANELPRNLYADSLALIVVKSASEPLSTACLTLLLTLLLNGIARSYV